jgi:hypothetical protein
MKPMVIPIKKERRKMAKLINGENSFVIDKCEACGFVSYSVITRCPSCGNMILTSEVLDEKTWRNQKEAGFKEGVKHLLKSPIWQAERDKTKEASASK